MTGLDFVREKAVCRTEPQELANPEEMLIFVTDFYFHKVLGALQS